MGYPHARHDDVRAITPMPPATSSDFETDPPHHRLRVVIANWRDTEHPEGGGSERYVETIAAGLAARGHDVTILCARYPGSAPQEWRDNVRIIRRGGKLTVYLWAIWLLAARRLGRPDVVIDVQNGVPFFTRIGATWPTVVLVHHVHREQWPVIYGRAAARFGWWVESRLAIRHYRRSRYVAVSTVTRDELAGLGVAADRIAVIHNGTSPAPTTTAIRAANPTIVVLGRLVPHKRVEHALSVAAQVRSVLPELRVRVVGDGWWRPHAEEHARRSGVDDITDFLGHVDEQAKHAELARAWVLAAPSLKEGWGLVVVEAAQHRVPAVGYRYAGGIAESVVDGQTGLLADDECEFAAHVARLLTDAALRERLGRAAERHAAGFTWESSVVAWERTLVAAARKRPTTAPPATARHSL